MKKKILLGVLSIFILVGSNVGTWHLKSVVDSRNLHPIEREFNKLSQKDRLLIMKVGKEALDFVKSVFDKKKIEI